MFWGCLDLLGCRVRPQAVLSDILSVFICAILYVLVLFYFLTWSLFFDSVLTNREHDIHDCICIPMQTFPCLYFIYGRKTLIMGVRLYIAHFVLEGLLIVFQHTQFILFVVLLVHHLLLI